MQLSLKQASLWGQGLDGDWAIRYPAFSTGLRMIRPQRCSGPEPPDRRSREAV